MDRELRKKYNEERKAMRDRHRAEEKEIKERFKDDRKERKKWLDALDEKHEDEEDLLDAKYGKKKKNKFMAAVIGLAIGTCIAKDTIFSEDIITKCHEITGYKRPFKYCVHEIKDSHPMQTILYVPGTLSTEMALIDGINARLNREVIDIMGKNYPRVITISMLPTKEEDITGLVDENKSGTLSLYNEERIEQLKEMWPEMEKNFVGERVLWGTSKGGFNAIQIFRHVSKSFSKIMLVSPLLMTCDPFEPKKINVFKVMAAISTQNWAMLATASEPPQCFQDMPHYQKDKSFWVMGSIEMVKAYFPLPDDWQENDPMTHIEFNQETRLALFCTMKDGFGFADPCLVYYAKANMLGINTKLYQTDTEHAVYDPKSMAEFLSQ